MNNYLQDEVRTKIEQQNKEKTEKFKERIAQFNDITTLSEAKELASQILRTGQEYEEFMVGNGRCTVLNKEAMFRVCFNTADEFICYDFA